MGYYACSNALTALKKELPWLKEADATALQSALKDLDVSYLRFFERIKKGEKPGFPHYRGKKNRRQSYRSKNTNTSVGRDTIAIIGSKIKLPKIGLVKASISKEVKGRILNATVSQNPSGKYFVSLCCTDVDIEPMKPTGAVVGVDLGIKDLAITSDGQKFPNNKYKLALDSKIRRLDRRLSRKTRGSKRWDKQRIKVARLEERVANQRRDAMQKLTTELVRNYDLICIEDLNVRGMLKNQSLSFSLFDSSFGEFRRELEYKANWYGRKIQVVDRFYPSSQLCSECGYRNNALRSLKLRDWTCPECGAHHDRDINAATNILHEGLRMLTA